MARPFLRRQQAANAWSPNRLGPAPTRSRNLARSRPFGAVGGGIYLRSTSWSGGTLGAVRAECRVKFWENTKVARHCRTSHLAGAARPSIRRLWEHHSNSTKVSSTESLENCIQGFLDVANQVTRMATSSGHWKERT